MNSIKRATWPVSHILYRRFNVQHICYKIVIIVKRNSPLFDLAGNRVMMQIFRIDLQIEAFDKRDFTLNNTIFVLKTSFLEWVDHFIQSNILFNDL